MRDQANEIQQQVNEDFMIDQKSRLKVMSLANDDRDSLFESQSGSEMDCIHVEMQPQHRYKPQDCDRIKPHCSGRPWRRRKQGQNNVRVIAHRMVSLIRLKLLIGRRFLIVATLMAHLASISTGVVGMNQFKLQPISFYGQNSIDDSDRGNQHRTQVDTAAYEYFLGDTSPAHSARPSASYDFSDQAKLFDDEDPSSLVSMSDELYDLQPSSASHATSAASPSVTKTEVTRAPSSTTSSTPNPAKSKSKPKVSQTPEPEQQKSQPVRTGPVGGNLISNQLNTVSRVLHHMAPGSVDYQQHNIDTSRAAALAHRVRKTINAAAAVSSIGSSPTRKQHQQQVSQDNNQQPGITGDIEFPSMPGVKPFMMSALKTIPVKLSSVGWKLLQLIAWKKIYRSHHPATGEVVIEPDVKSGHGHKGSASALDDDGDDDDDAEIGTGNSISKSPLGGLELELNKQAGGPMANKMSKISQMYPRHMNGGAHNQIVSPALHGLRGFGPHGFMFDRGSESIVHLQKHLLPHQLLHTQANQNPASAASAATAAAAAALQSQLIHQHLVRNLASRGLGVLEEDYKASPQVSPNVSGLNTLSAHSGSAQAQSVTNQTTNSALARPSVTSAVVKGSSATTPKDLAARSALAALDSAGNWFASPAQAYANAAAAAAAANAAAAAVSAVHQDGLHRSRVGATFQGLMPFNQMMYQSLFDNAAALAVQNAVKLPQANPMTGSHSSPTFDFIEQPDSLDSGSSMSFGPSATSTSSIASLSDWTGQPHRLGLLSNQDASARKVRAAQSALSIYQNRPRQISDSLLALNDFPASGFTSETSGLNSLTNFDDNSASSLLPSSVSF